jgi:hypothetical protein
MLSSCFPPFLKAYQIEIASGSRFAKSSCLISYLDALFRDELAENAEFGMNNVTHSGE